MKRAALLALAAFAALPCAAGTTPEARDAIAELGRVNGQALACQQPAISSRARNAVATGAAKTQEYGELFERATNSAYLEQGKGSACPDAAALNQQLQAAEKLLQAAFPAVQ